MKTAVIVLDIQNDFCDSEGAFTKYLGWNPTPIQEMVERLIPFIEQSRMAGDIIVFSQMINSAEESPVNLKKKVASWAEKQAGRWPFGLIRGSWGWQFYKVQPEEGDVVLEKKYYDLFSNAELRKVLDDHHIERLVITGLYTEVCILGTVQRGFSDGFEIVVPRNLTASVTHRAELRNAALEIMQSYFAEVVDL